MAPMMSRSRLFGNRSTASTTVRPVWWFGSSLHSRHDPVKRYPESHKQPLQFSAASGACAQSSHRRLKFAIPRGHAAQCDGWRFTKDGAISHGKATKFGKPIVAGDLGHARDGWISTQQRSASPVQALQQHISRGAYTKELGAAHAERS